MVNYQDHIIIQLVWSGTALFWNLINFRKNQLGLDLCPSREGNIPPCHCALKLRLDNLGDIGSSLWKILLSPLLELGLYLFVGLSNSFDPQIFIWPYALSFAKGFKAVKQSPISIPTAQTHAHTYLNIFMEIPHAFYFPSISNPSVYCPPKHPHKTFHKIYQV